MSYNLFCLSYAGGSTAMYFGVEQALPSRIRPIRLEMAGKGVRVGETLYHTFDELLDDAYHMLLSRLSGNRYSLFGYSMGALVAYELAVKLEENSAFPPEFLFLAASTAPDVPQKDKAVYLYSDDDLITEVASWGGMERADMDSPEMKELFLPPLRNDLRLLAEYYRQAETRRFPVLSRTKAVILYSETEEAEITRWNGHFLAPCRYIRCDGGHFFIQKEGQPKKIADIISNSIL